MSELVSDRPDASGSEASPAFRHEPQRFDVSPASTVGILATLSATLSACGGGSGSGTGGGTTSPPPPATPVEAISSSKAVRFLLQAQFAASDDDIYAVKSQGYSAWLDTQFAKPLSQTATAWLDSQGHNVPVAGIIYNSAQGDWMAWRMLMTGDDQLRKRCALALSEMMVATLDAVSGIWPYYIIAGYWDMLNASAFGNFRTLLENITLNPAVGMLLATRGNMKENPATGRQPDENYAREVMQLFTIGLYELNLDGSEKTDLLGTKTETYTQSDISGLARVFTGYDLNYSNVTYQTVDWSANKVPSTDFTRDPMALTASKHSMLAATFLGVTIPAGTDGATARTVALDTLFNHANTGPFFARQMIQKLVTSNPSPAYIRRVAQVFNDNGAGVRGDLKAVWKAILTDSEARNLSAAATAGKLREPVVRLAQWARTFNVTSATGKWEVADLRSGANALGQSPLRSPSVFNFFRPGYVPPQTQIADQGLLAPEFQLHNETTTAAYINLMTAVIAGGIKDVKPDYSFMLGMATTPRTLVDWLNLRLTGDQLSTATTDTIVNAISSVAATSDAGKLNRVQSAILLIMACPEYLIQK